mmetsp:Transcript_1378/g.3492  ORF Transcript_1378/g.3492 Transcript_1378/m.3492 type:complete len:266 (+) Transcript_1378:459-1256(+)
MLVNLLVLCSSERPSTGATLLRFWPEGPLASGFGAKLERRSAMEVLRSGLRTGSPESCCALLLCETSRPPCPVRSLLACSLSLSISCTRFFSPGNSPKASSTTDLASVHACTQPWARTVAVRCTALPTRTASPMRPPSLTSRTRTPLTSTNADPRWMMMAKSPSSPSFSSTCSAKKMVCFMPRTRKSQKRGSLSLKNWWSTPRKSSASSARAAGEASRLPWNLSMRMSRMCSRLACARSRKTSRSSGNCSSRRCSTAVSMLHTTP